MESKNTKHGKTQFEKKDCLALANLLFPNIKKTVEDYLAVFPPRACTAFRLAPSPTGYLHLGTLGMSLVNTRLAKSMRGIAYLRIEDTDQKREVAGATQQFMTALARFGVVFDEGYKIGGDYGPYIQSERTEIYHAFAKRLVELGRAYPCFCSAECLAKLRENQLKGKQKTGYYGEHAKCVTLTFDEIRKQIEAGKPYVLRFDTSADTLDLPDARVTWQDMIKGDMSLPCEVNHPVILKSDGIPPYNLAHVVDDTLMRTSHVIRGEDWLVSTAEHIQLFKAFGFSHPVYAHPPVICVLDNGNKRKLSKRKDVIAIADNFLDRGYPFEAVIEYLLTLYNTDFELWRIANPTLPNTEFAFKFDKIGSNSPLFDENKLNDISKNIIAKMTCEQIKCALEKYLVDKIDKQSNIVRANIEKFHAVLCIDRETEKPRKDLARFGDVYTLYSYIVSGAKFSNDFSAREREALSAYASVYDANDTREVWFEKIRALCLKFGYCPNIKDYKKDPSSYCGHVGDFSQIIRRAITGSVNSPDLYTIMQIIGVDEVNARFKGI